MRFHQLRGQTTVEFAFAGVWLILLMMAVLCFGFITFQKSHSTTRCRIWQTELSQRLGVHGRQGGS